MTDNDKKELVLRLPEDIFAKIKNYKKTSGVSYTNCIYNAIIWWLFSKGLMTLDEIKGITKKEIKTEAVIVNQMPEGVKFCDGDSCEIDYGIFKEDKETLKMKYGGC